MNCTNWREQIKLLHAISWIRNMDPYHRRQTPNSCDTRTHLLISIWHLCMIHTFINLEIVIGLQSTFKYPLSHRDEITLSSGNTLSIGSTKYLHSIDITNTYMSIIKERRKSQKLQQNALIYLSIPITMYTSLVNALFPNHAFKHSCGIFSRIRNV